MSLKLSFFRSLFLAFFTSLLFPFFSSAQNYDVEELSIEFYNDAIERTGKVAFKRTLNLSFKSSGYLTQLSVDAGDLFEAKKVLASLETSELMADKNATYARLVQAKKEVKRIEQLIETKVSSDRELDRANTAVETARSAYQVSNYNISKSQLIAPFSGIVLARHTELGEYQTPGREVLEVAALKKNRVVKVALTGAEISQVKLGQKVEVELPQLGTMTGKIDRIPAIANADGNLFTIDVLLPDLDYGHGIIAGQLAMVRIYSEEGNFVYRLPVAALIKVDDQGKAVVMVKDNEAENGKPYRHAFEIFKMDSKYIYLDATKFDDSIHIVTRGWQHIRAKN